MTTVYLGGEGNGGTAETWDREGQKPLSSVSSHQPPLEAHRGGAQGCREHLSGRSLLRGQEEVDLKAHPHQPVFRMSVPLHFLPVYFRGKPHVLAGTCWNVLEHTEAIKPEEYGWGTNSVTSLIHNPINQNSSPQEFRQTHEANLGYHVLPLTFAPPTLLPAPSSPTQDVQEGSSLGVDSTPTNAAPSWWPN